MLLRYLTALCHMRIHVLCIYVLLRLYIHVHKTFSTVWRKVSQILSKETSNEIASTNFGADFLLILLVAGCTASMCCPSLFLDMSTGQNPVTCFTVKTVNILKQKIPSSVFGAWKRVSRPNQMPNTQGWYYQQHIKSITQTRSGRAGKLREN